MGIVSRNERGVQRFFDVTEVEAAEPSASKDGR
jgi:hypothetical protein